MGLKTVNLLLTRVHFCSFSFTPTRMIEAFFKVPTAFSEGIRSRCREYPSRVWKVPATCFEATRNGPFGDIRSMF